MPSAKISALTAATTPLATDLHVLARSTTNRKITTAALFFETLTYTQFIDKVVNGELIAGRWYEVTEAGYDLQQVIAVLATASNNWSPRVIWLSSPNDPVECDAENLNQDFSRYYDSKGNDYERYHQIGGTMPPIGAGSSWSHNRIDNASNCSFQDPIGAPINFCTFDGGNYQMTMLTATSCEFIGSTIYNQYGYGLTMNRCRLKNSYIDNQIDGPNSTTIINTELHNCTLTIIGTLDIQLNNSRFENCTVSILNGAVVDGLTIIGKGDGQTYYTIDGNLQGQVYANWAGTVIAEETISNPHRSGLSTVRMDLIRDNTGNPGTYDSVSKEVFLPENSVVGVYVFKDLETDTNYQVDYLYQGSQYYYHPITFNVCCSIGIGTLAFNMENQQVAATVDDKMIYYHGKTNKVGQLRRPCDYVTFQKLENTETGSFCWYLMYGAHYD